MRPKPLYRGNYHRRSKALRESAYADPMTKCWRCGRTYAEALKLWGPQGAAWQAGHIIDGHKGSPLAPEHAKCNTSAGGRLGRAKQMRRANPRSPNG